MIGATCENGTVIWLQLWIRKLLLVVYTVFSAFSFSLCFILFLLTHVAASSSESLSPKVLILLQHTQYMTLDSRVFICIISQLLNQIMVLERKISPKQILLNTHFIIWFSDKKNRLASIQNIDNRSVEKNLISIQSSVLLKKISL